MKKLLTVILLLALFVSIFRFTVYSQTESESDVEDSVYITCLNATRPDGSSLNSKPPKSGNEDVKITGECPMGNCHFMICGPPISAQKHCKTDKDTGDEECDLVYLEDRPYVCTTGDATVDENGKTFDEKVTPEGQDNTRFAKYLPTISPGVFNGPVMDAKMYALDHVSYDLYAVAIAPPTVETGKGGDEVTPVEGKDPSQQLGQAHFSFPSPSQAYPAGTQQTCTSIFWDPNGRVFDSVSNEPFDKGKAKVTLLNVKDQEETDLLSNNVLTNLLGFYNILIGHDDNYKLKASASNYEFTNVNLSTKINDLYKRIYQPGDVFYEAQAMPDPEKRHDIPLKPIGRPFERPVDFAKETKIYENINLGGIGMTRIDLRTVHPKTIVNIISKADGSLIASNGQGKTLAKTSDIDGFWQAIIKKDSIPQAGFNIELIKNPDYYLYGKSSTITNKITIDYNPILQHIEGFAYDSQNKIMSKAIVSVMFKISNVKYFSTVADDKGFFTISAKNLPMYEYYLKYTNPITKTSIIQSTTEFVKKNNSYIAENKINLMTSKQSQKIKTTNNVDSEISGNELSKTPEKTSASTKTVSPINLQLVMITLVIILLFGTAIGMFFYIKKNSTPKY